MATMCDGWRENAIRNRTVSGVMRACGAEGPFLAPQQNADGR